MKFYLRLTPSPFVKGLFLIALLPALTNCVSAIRAVGIGFFYSHADLPENQILHDISYRSDHGADPIKHKLDLFLPTGKNWPVIIFIHGGGWNTGDKGLAVGSKDVYGNIGRYYASRGIGVATINYRLLPGVTLQDEIADCAAAFAWVYHHIKDYGGNPKALFLSGHSAGTQLAAHLALNPEVLKKQKLSPTIICGVIAVSGAGFDLTDKVTYELGADIKYYEERFQKENNGVDWQKVSSPLTFLNNHAPPFLILYATGESKPLQRQSQLLYQRLTEKNNQAKLLVISGEDHDRMVLVLSHPKKTASPAILDFIKNHACR